MVNRGTMNYGGGEPPVVSGGRSAPVNYKTRKRPAPTVYTITGGDVNFRDGTCACCPPPVGIRDDGQEQQREQENRRRPRTWTCGVAGGFDDRGSAGLTRSRTFTSNYERAISSLLWQPYECRSSSNSLDDDGDVAVWLNATGRYEPLSSRSSLSLSTIPRSAGSCSSSVCRLLDDGGGGDNTPPRPCWCTAETATAAAATCDPNIDGTAAARATTGYRCPPRGSLLQRRSNNAAVGGRPPSTRPSTAVVQSNAYRPQSRTVPPRCVSAGDWCCDNENVDDDEDDDDEDDDDDYYYYDYAEDDDDDEERADNRQVDGDEDVRDDNRVRAVAMNDVITGGGAVDVHGRPCGGGGAPDAKTPPERTYASTEAQTDETACSSAYREQRRRERRERRQQQRRVHPPPPPPPALSSSSLLSPPPLPLSGVAGLTAAVPIDPDRLPDLLLNSHLPPPLYTTGGGGVCDVAMSARAATNMQASLLPAPFQHPHQPTGAPVGSSPVGNPSGGFRLPFGIIPARRRRSLHYCSEEDTPKSCCGLLTLPDTTSTASIRWFIGVVFLAGICSALVGTVLGATRASGREHLTVALLMIGVGVILVAISGIAWRLTAGQEASSSCGAVFGLGRSLDDAAEANRRFVPRLPPSYGRPHHPYAAMMYPEFEYRAPPPSYQASMQEYRLRLLLLDRQTNMPPVTASPPPTYRSQPGTLIRGQNICCRSDPGELYLYQPSALINHHHHQQQQQQQQQHQQHHAVDYSGPPSYRSRTSTLRPGCHLIMDPAAAMAMSGSTAVSVHHSRNPSQLSGAASEAVGGDVILTAVDDKTPADHHIHHLHHHHVMGDGDVDVDDLRDIVVVDEKTAPPVDHIGGGPVTIVQTTPARAVPNAGVGGGTTVVVTVSGAATDNDGDGGVTAVRSRETEMDILAHL